MISFSLREVDNNEMDDEVGDPSKRPPPSTPKPLKRELANENTKTEVTI
jgi:hypothetical protein